MNVAKSADEEVSNLVVRVTRVAEENIGWYQRRKRWQRRLYYASGVVTLVTAALISVLIVLISDKAQAATAVCGGIVVVSTGLSGFFRWQTNWVSYTAAQDHLELLLQNWATKMDRMHEVTDPVQRLQRIRQLGDQTLTEIAAVRGAETVATITPTAKPDWEQGSPARQTTAAS